MLTVLLAAGLTFTAPQGWQQGKPGSSMRVAESTLPRVQGDAEDAQLVLYFFGGQGGSVDANIERWVGQIQQPDGKPSSAVAKKITRTVNGLAVTLSMSAEHTLPRWRPGRASATTSRITGCAPASWRRRTARISSSSPDPQKRSQPMDRAFEQFVSSFKFQ